MKIGFNFGYPQLVWEWETWGEPVYHDHFSYVRPTIWFRWSWK